MMGIIHEMPEQLKFASEAERAIWIKQMLFEQFVNGNASAAVMDNNMGSYREGIMRGCLLTELAEAFGCDFQVEFQHEGDFWYFYCLGTPQLQPGFLSVPGNSIYSAYLPEADKSNLDVSPVTTAVDVSDRKKPPRPMNCWMLYRDEQHKLFKAANPELSVQEISTICSNNWKNLPEAQKEHYREQARKAKDAHHAQYPGYKYCPRKPGEKKKRQSRKAMRDAATATGTVPATTSPVAETPESEVFDFNSFPDIPMMNSSIDFFPEASTEAIVANLDSLIPSDGAQFTETTPHTNPAPSFSADHLYDAETLRQERLEAEFGALFGSEVHEEMVAFCERADESATLPSLFSGVF